MDIEALYKDYGKVLFGYLIAQTGDTAAAEDIFQETFLRMQQYGKSFSGFGSAKNYLFQTARNIFRNWLRQQKTERRQMPEDVIVDADPATATERESLRLAIAACVRSLPEKERNILLLKEYENLKVREIAERLSLPEGTVKTRLRAALQTLKNRLQSAAILERF